METIKFKAWDEDPKHMYQAGNPHLLLDSNGICINAQTGVKLKPLLFTGLHDKNGKEIYEGDIIQMHSEFYNVLENEDNDFDRDYIGEIVIQASKGTVLKRPKWHCNITDTDGRDNFYKPITAKRSEVIGNIYENPELI